MFPIFLLLIYEVSGGDQVHHDQVQHHHHQLQEPCSPLRLSKCSDLLTRALDKHDFGFVTTELGLNSLCEDMMRGIACVEEFVANCSSTENRNSFQVTASGALETSTQLCTPNSQLRKEFLSNSSCFREIALSESACSTEYKSIINEVMTNNDNSNDTTDDDETPEVTLTRLCCGYGKFVKCSYRHVARVPTCSTGSTHFIQEYLKRNIGTPLLDHCTQLLSDEEYCNSSDVTSFISPSLIISSVIIISILFFH